MPIPAPQEPNLNSFAGWENAQPFAPNEVEAAWSAEAAEEMNALLQEPEVQRELAALNEDDGTEG